MVTRFISLFAIVAISVLLSGCTYGLLYTSTSEPLSINMNKTPRGTATGASELTMVTIPTTVISAGWGSMAIEDAARVAGIEEIYYVDLHTFTVLAGLWRQQTLSVYGRAAKGPIK